MARNRRLNRDNPAPMGPRAVTPAGMAGAADIVRHNRPSLPLWRIKGIFTLLTPLHIGSGHDVEFANGPADDDEAEPFVANVVRDCDGKPCIPGASLKGALRALARLRGVDAATMKRLFGSRDTAANTTDAAQVEFAYAYLEPESLPGGSGLPGYSPTGPHAVSAQLAHAARNRDFGTPQHQALYLEPVVPPDCRFNVECHARGLSETEIGRLLALFQEASSANSSFRLGAGKAVGQGVVDWHLTSVKQLGDAGAILTAAAAGIPMATIWAGLRERRERITIPLIPAQTQPPIRLSAVALKFHTPFLVYERQDRTVNRTAPHGKPRRAHDERGVLPASSLHGALRSQAEKILRTLGLSAAPGTAVPTVREWADTAGLDLASVLFGAPGWRSVLQVDDFLAPKEAATLDHEMVAIDRVTGGGSDGAKFTIQALDCPTLSGAFAIDVRRLRLLEPQNPGVAARALGLLLHALRDLDEGDIPLGYGAAKGYGISTGCCVDTLSRALSQVSAPATADASLQTFSTWAAAQGVPAGAAPAPACNALAVEEIASPLVAPGAAAADEKFHNPYVFIPFGTPDPARWTAHATIPGAGHGHARFDPARLHGRIVCRLQATTPLFVGAGAEPGNTLPKLQKLFKLKGEVALPATSLRGMVSSLHEAITCSAPRVLEDRSYSVRQSAGSAALSSGSSSAIGRMHCQGDDWYVEPLTLPTYPVGGALPQAYRPCFSGSGLGNHGYSKVLLEYPVADPASAYAQSKQACFGDADGRGYWYVSLWEMALATNGTVQPQDGADLRVSAGQVIGQRPAALESVDFPAWPAQLARLWLLDNPRAAPISEAEYQELVALVPTAASKFTRGLIRAMNAPNGARKFPGHRNELFIPVPEALDANPHRLRCLPSCVQRFEALADEFFPGTERLPANAYQHMPYTPIGRPRDDKALRPRTGDLVFFKPNDVGNAIAEVSFSSIWRGRVEVPAGFGGVAAYSAARVVSDTSSHFAPLGSPQRPDLLSPSELLFGTVEIRPKRSSGTPRGANAADPPIKAFASKVRFGYALPTQLITPLPTVTLKILSSPKPPSPTMYFKLRNNANATYISKADLVANPTCYELKGRKRYLHALRDNGAPQGLDDCGARSNAADTEPWRSRNTDPRTANQKVRIAPLPSGSEFLFEVDFSNLDMQELAALCASLDPHSSFEHKLGMGKPLGLGSAKVTLEGLYLVDRRARYLERSFAANARYHGVWHGTRPIVGGTDTLAEHLSREAAAQATPGALSATDLARKCMSALLASNPAVFNALLLTGAPAAVRHPVHYPQVARVNLEDKTYEWFRVNDQGRAQWLYTFTDDSTGLPTLNR